MSEPCPSGTPDPGDYSERGGARWGETMLAAWNVSWPFTQLHVSRNGLRIETRFLPVPSALLALPSDSRAIVSRLPVLRVTFAFDRSEILRITRIKGRMSAGIAVEHEKHGYPPLLVFWSSRPARLLSELAARGYGSIS